MQEIITKNRISGCASYRRLKLLKDGLSVNIMYTVDNTKKRAIGFKLSDGMAIPKELEGEFYCVDLEAKELYFCRAIL